MKTSEEATSLFNGKVEKTRNLTRATLLVTMRKNHLGHLTQNEATDGDKVNDII